VGIHAHLSIDEWRARMNWIDVIGMGRQITVWDLKAQRLHSVVAAHEGRVSSLYFFPREPLLLSCSPDNALKMWVFDGADGSARLLKSREGHTAPPRRIRYYGNVTDAAMGSGADGASCQVLSAGGDRALRVFHTARDVQSREMSQGPLARRAKKRHVRPEDLKLRPITGLAAVETRARDWGNVLTCHQGDHNAYVWKFESRALSQVGIWECCVLPAGRTPHHPLCDPAHSLPHSLTRPPAGWLAGLCAAGGAPTAGVGEERDEQPGAAGP
jgi:U3 small nucleolar RNA-associated protein 21